MDHYEILPGLVIEVDKSKWEFVDGMGILPLGKEHHIEVDLRITETLTGETSKVESVLIVRTP